MSQAGVLDVINSAPTIPTTFVTDAGDAIPVANTLNILGIQGVTTTGAGSTVTVSGVLATAGATVGAATIGVAAYSSADFTVTAGFVELVSGDAIDFLGVQVATLPGVNPVAPDAGGLLTIDGVIVPQTSIPIQTASRALNNLRIEVQRAGSSLGSNMVAQGLASFDNTQFVVDANGWVQLIGMTPPLLAIDVQANTGPGTDPVIASATGVIVVNGAAVAAQTIPVRSNSLAANTYQIEVQRAADTTGTDTISQGLASFDDTQFLVDANGYVTGLNGLGIVSVDVDAATAPGSDPVLPTTGGQIGIIGLAVAAQTIPVRTHSTAANQLTLEVQRAADSTGTNATAQGLASFDDTQFLVDANGWVQLIGMTPPLLAIDVQANTGPGTDPVIASATGVIVVNGAAVAAQTIPVRSNSLAANTYQIEVQRAADSTGTDTTSQGLSSYNDLHFVADANGYVSLLGTGMVVWSDQGASVSVLANSGSFSTASVTLTTPAAPANGDILQFVNVFGASLVVTAAGTQILRIGSSASTAGGTQTSVDIGDAVSFVYRASSTTWWSTSVNGNWGPG